MRDLNETIWGYGLALENLGDIDKQTISGAVSTATHGTGSRFRNLSSLIEAVELVLPDGTLLEISPESEPEPLPAARVGLGALGVIATMTLRAPPAFTVRRPDSPLPLTRPWSGSTTSPTAPTTSSSTSSPTPRRPCCARASGSTSRRSRATPPRVR